MPPLRLSIIVAMAENRVIGNRNKLPWRIAADLKFFKSVTMGKPMIMGRKTFESIGGPLPGRTSIVITHASRQAEEYVRFVHGIDQALEAAAQIAKSKRATGGGNEIMVIGGEQIYRMALPRVGRIYLTEVHKEFAGEARFPEFNRDGWREISRTPCPPTGADTPPASFVVLDRRKP